MSYLRAYTNLFGTKIFERDPEIRSFRDVLYIPRRPGITDHDKSFGLYDCYGRVISSAGPRRQWPNRSVGQSESSCVDPSGAHPVAPDGAYLYGGHVGGHFGHFITETLPRYWHKKIQERNARIVVHSGDDLKAIFSQPWVKKFFSFVGLREENFILFDRPTIIRNILVPGTSFEEDHFAHKMFSFMGNAIGDRFRDELPLTRPIYLSRSRAQSKMRVFEGEELLDEALTARGFDIVHPETLDIEQQLSLFSGKRPLCGFVGSAFHNSIFARAPIGVALCHSNFYSSNFALMDAVNDSKIAYLQTPGLTTQPAKEFETVQVSIHDPRRLAAFIDETVSGRVWEQPVDRRDELTLSAAPVGERMRVKTAHGRFLYADKFTGVVYSPDRPGEYDCEVLACRLNDASIGLLADRPSLSLTIDWDNRCAPIIPYEAIPNQGGFCLLNPDMNRFLCAVSDGTVNCGRDRPEGWERFELVALN